MDKVAVDALFFDFDGTLGDTVPEIRAGWLKALQAVNVECKNFDQKFKVGPSMQNTSKILCPDLEGEKLEELRAAYLRFYDGTTLNTTSPYPWVRSMLAELIKRGKKLFIVTNKRKIPLTKLVRHYDFGKYFSGYFTPDIFPDYGVMTKSQMLQTAINISGVLPEHCMMIGDTITDIEAGQENKVFTCAVTWGYGPRAELETSGADLIIKNSDFIGGFDSKYI